MSYIYAKPLTKAEILPDNWPESGGGGGGGGTDNYNSLSNKPSINDVELAGNKTANQLGLGDLKSVQAYSAMPSSVAVGTTVMYTGESGVYTNGAIYRKTTSGWTLIQESTATVDDISNEEIEQLF